MTKEEYTFLYEKYASGNCTDEERRRFEAYSDDFSLDDTEWDTDTLGNENELADKMYARLYDDTHSKSFRGISLLYKLSAAAVLFVVLSSGLYLYLNNSSDPVPAQQQLSKKADVGPGGKKAILNLQNGTKMVLDQSTNGVVSIQGNIVITGSMSGKVLYDSYSLADNNSNVKDYNSINIPRGGEYELRLPDGTRVWLNSESSLKFPAVFSGRDRKVELTGEAYFEVAKNALVPFKVYANGTEIEVLGTEFNVNAYRKGRVTTSLLGGSVKLKVGGQESLLKPGQEAVSLASGRIMVNETNVKDAIAWKNGYFIYQDDNIYQIMADAARWYDVDVEYRGDLRGKGFYGNVARYDNISELLKNIELTGSIKFKIEGRRVIVMSK